MNKDHAFDAVVAAYLLNPLKNDYDFLDVEREQLDLLLDDKLEEQMKAFYEAYVAYASVKPLANKLVETKMDKLFYEIEMPLVEVLADMQYVGIKANKEELMTFGNELKQNIESIKQDIYALCGEEFNVNSTQQLGVILFEKLKLPVYKKTKSGYSTDVDVLEKYLTKYRNSTISICIKIFKKRDRNRDKFQSEEIFSIARSSNTESERKNNNQRMKGK